MKITKLTCENLEKPLIIDTQSPRFSFCLESDENKTTLESYRIVVSSSKENCLNSNWDMWDSGIIKSRYSQQIQYGGLQLKSKSTYFWQVLAVGNKGEAVSEISSFGTGMFNISDWKFPNWREKFIGIEIPSALAATDHPDKDALPCTYLRKAFNISKQIKSAQIYATAYGLYELYLNNKKVGNYEFAPLWTDYRYTLQYQCYDVTEQITTGDNVVGAILADGWFCGNIMGTGRKQYADYPLAIMLHMEIIYADGEKEIVLSDTSWKGSTGPIIYSDMQTGEFYDATKELGNWCESSFDAKTWQNVIIPKELAPHRIVAAKGPQVSVNQLIKPVSMELDKNKNVIVNMGQNMVGYVQIKLKAKRETKVTLRYGEMLEEDGTLYTANLRTALQTDIYICKGSGYEVFTPRFTFHGFQYVEISGLDYIPEIDDIVGKVIYSACELTGQIETSNQLINKLFSNQLWGQKGNFLGIPTDCPQRNERVGWTGDAQIFSKTACYNMQCVGFYEKYVYDLMDAQGANGAIPNVVPHVRRGGRDNSGGGDAAWGDAIFIIPWILYQMYGNTHILEVSYNSMERYFEYLISASTDFIKSDTRFGDWLNVDSVTPKDVLATAFVAYDALLLTQIAKTLGKHTDAKKYDDYFNKIKNAFHKEFVDEDMVIKGDTQCCYLLALKMELIDKPDRPKIVRHLIRTITEREYHLSTGFVGVSYLMPVLCDYGHSDIAYRLLLNETYPSWLYSVKNGATTMWERWNSYTIEGGFGDVNMNSFNHYAFGSIGEWMYGYMAGIQPLEPGFSRIQIKPCIDKSLEYVKASYQSVYGEITSSWKFDGELCYVNVKIPANTTAEIILPSEQLSVGSGMYSFQFRWEGEYE